MRALTWIAFPLALSACLEDEDEPVAPHVFFASPANGDRVGTDFHIELAVTGFSVKPAGTLGENTGYLTLFIDEPCVPAGELIRPSTSRISLTGGETETDIALDAGPHRLCVQASDGRGVALALSQVIEIEVIEARVRIVEPRYGAALGRRVHFKVESEGMIIEPAGESRPGAGHYYLVIDEECPPESFPISLAGQVVNLVNGESEIDVDLPTGQHEVWLGIADGHDLALAPRTRVQFYSY